MIISTRIPLHNVSDMAGKYENAIDQFDHIGWNEIHVFRQLINKQFSDISKQIYFKFVDNEPYGENPKIEDMLSDFRRGVIKIHTTGNDSKIWDTFYNLQFRAIHDYLHCLHGIEFTHVSECRVHEIQCTFSLKKCYTKLFPHLDWETYVKVLRSEIVYQSAYKEVYGKFHIGQKIILADLIELEEDFDV